MDFCGAKMDAFMVISTPLRFDLKDALLHNSLNKSLIQNNFSSKNFKH